MKLCIKITSWKNGVKILFGHYKNAFRNLFMHGSQQQKFCGIFIEFSIVHKIGYNNAI